MALQDFRVQVKDLTPGKPICVAEVDEASAMNVSCPGAVRDPKLQSSEADGTETVELGGGDQTVLSVR